MDVSNHSRREREQAGSGGEERGGLDDRLEHKEAARVIKLNCCCYRGLVIYIIQARGPKKHLKRVNAPRHWMLSKMDGIFVSKFSLYVY